MKNRANPQSFSGRLKVAAEHRQLRQVDIARHCDVTRAAVSGWFHGSREPSGGNLLKLADVLAVRQEWLLLHDDGPAERMALDVTRKVTGHDPAKRVPPFPLLPHQLATDGALMGIYDKLLRLAQDWLALPEKDREQWSRTMQREAQKHRAKSGPDDPHSEPPKINLTIPKPPAMKGSGSGRAKPQPKKRNGR